MFRTILLFCLIQSIQSIEEPPSWVIFIGQGKNSLYFALRPTLEWDWGLNYCHNYRLMPGSIETEEDHQLITNFLNTSTSIEDESRFLWLPATDHRKEGVFQWMWNMKEVEIGSWAPGMPSINRTANCMAINRLGQYIEDSCHESKRRYHTLCEAQYFYHGEPDCRIPSDESEDEMIFTRDSSEIDDQVVYEVRQGLSLIGFVGNITYFVSDEMISWSENLDLCHSAGLRLATPEQPEQLEFIRNYVSQQQTIFHLGGTDRLSVSCLKSNKEFRWFYSGNPIANQTDLNGNFWWYLCTVIGGDEMWPSGCARGGGAFAHAICEGTV